MEPLKVFHIKHIHSSIQYQITSRCDLVLIVARTGYTAERGKASLGRKIPDNARTLSRPWDGLVDDSLGSNFCWSFTTVPGFKEAHFSFPEGLEDG
jgi:hypothetical protein